MIDTEQKTFSTRSEPSESTGPCPSEKDFIFSHMKGKNPTLLFRSGDIVGGHTIDLVDLFPLVFPYGWGSPSERRGTKVGKSAVLRHYCRISLPQMQQSQFLLVLCSMWQRLESFNKCIISCKSSFKSSILANHLLMLSSKEVETAMRHILDGEKTSDSTL